MHFFSEKHLLENHFYYNINECFIENCNETTDLGATVDNSTLKFVSQIAKLPNTALRILGIYIYIEIPMISRIFCM